MATSRTDFINKMREALDALEEGHYSIVNFDIRGDVSMYINRNYGRVTFRLGEAEISAKLYEATEDERTMYFGVPELSARDAKGVAQRRARREEIQSVE